MPDTVVVQTVWEFVIDPWRNIWGAGIIFVDSILKKKKEVLQADEERMK